MRLHREAEHTAEARAHQRADETREFTDSSLGTFDYALTLPVVAAGSTGEEWTAALGTQPTYSIHSRADRVAPFAAAERVARALQSAGRDVHFEALDDVSHYELSAYTEALRRAAGWIAARWAR
jgi:pimeloyl-ACP methyl ester carboxylesterase